MNTAILSQPPVPTIFPSWLPDIVELTLNRLVQERHPGLTLNFNTTWLNLYETRQAETVESDPPLYSYRLIRSINLFDSLLEHFLDTLKLTDENDLSWFTTPTAVGENNRALSLDRAQIIALYTAFSAGFASAYQQSLADYWTILDPQGKSRQTRFIEERAKVLYAEAQVWTEQGRLSTTQASMLRNMLGYSLANDDQRLKMHGVYNLTLATPEHALAFAGCFVLSHAACSGTPHTEDARLGPVVLYTPTTGVEGFESFARLSESLNRRLADPEEHKGLWCNTELRWLPSTTPLPAVTAWRFESLNGNFLMHQLQQQIAKQQADFIYAVETARNQALDARSFNDLLLQVLDPRHQFDNYLALERNEKSIVQARMPAWWQAMPRPQRQQWLEAAKTCATSIVEIHSLTHEQGDQLDSTAFIQQYTDDLINECLARNKITVPASRIRLTLTVDTTFPSPTTLGVRTPGTESYTLSTLGLNAQAKLALSQAEDILATDALNGQPIPALGHKTLHDLFARMDTDGAFERFLDTRLKSGDYATTLKEKSGRLIRAQMRQGLLVAKSESFAPTGLEWIEAVLENPVSSTRASVNGNSIQVRFLRIDNATLSNILLIQPSDSDARKPLVLCTLNAPDGVMFRWFSSQEAMQRNFLTQAAYTQYLLLQLPEHKRAVVLGNIALDTQLRPYRLPGVFRFLANPLPLPAVLWSLVSFSQPSTDCLSDNYHTCIDHIQTNARQHWQQMRVNDSGSPQALAHLALDVALFFLPAPMVIPLALGATLFCAWEGFHLIDQDDYKGAAKELLNALGYLVVAEVGRLTLPEQLPTPIRPDNPAPALVRRIGPDGNEHIGYLLSPAGAPRLIEPGKPLEAAASKFNAVQVDRQTFFFRNRFNLFGHCRLYRQDPFHPGKLLHYGEFGLRDSQGLWKRFIYNSAAAQTQAMRIAGSRLDALVQSWPKTLNELSAQERTDFEARYMALARSSNTEDLTHITDYCEGGSSPFNSLLRSQRQSAELKLFLNDFYRLHACSEQAYRATNISRAGLQRLQDNLGGLFADHGVQSASLNRVNATLWSVDPIITQHANPDTLPIYMIFDACIPKKNLFTTFLGDHVAIAPDTPLQLLAIREVEQQWYAYFSAPQQLASQWFDLFSGAPEHLI
ncbi:hypothetical protein PS3A_30840 [Pseudomonas sp. 3A(2025)]